MAGGCCGIQRPHTLFIGPHYEARYTRQPLPEDLDNDCVVTVIDIMQVAAQWGTADPLADVNDDGTVDVNDVQQVAGEWRETCHVLAGIHIKFDSSG